MYVGSYTCVWWHKYVATYMLMHKTVTLFGVGIGSFGPLEPALAPCILQTKGSNKVYSVLVNVEQVIVGQW